MLNMETTVRIHYDGERAGPHFVKCVDFIKTLGESYYIANEMKANRPHIQAYVFMTRYKTHASLRDRLKKTLKNEKGELSYSISECREGKVRFIAYLLKEGPGAFVASCNLQQVESEAMLLREAFIKDPPRRPQSLYQKMIHDIGNNHMTEPKVIAKAMLMWFYHANKLIPDQHTLKKYVTTYCFGRDPETQADAIVEDMYKWEN
ncbi:MAG: putative replicase [Circoviridae sp.]|nr:MAG: putative replicase [Circoviridae sp.]